MKIIATVLCACLVLVAFTVNEAVAKDVVVTGRYAEKDTWKPLSDFPEFFPSLAFLDELEALAADNPAAAETVPWQTVELSKMCSDPVVFAVEEMLVPQREIMKHKCFIFVVGDAERLTRSTTPLDHEIIKFAGRRVRFPTNATYIHLNGRFIDNLSRPQLAPMKSEAATNDAFCVTEKKRSTCSLPDIPEPICRVVRYGSDKMVVDGLKRDMPLSSCAHFVEGKNLFDSDTVQGDVCYIRTTGDGKVVADCSTFALIDHSVGKGDVFSQFSDSVIVGTQEDKYFVDPANMNLLFIKRVEGLPSTKVIGSGESTRIITVGVDQEI